MKPLRTLKVVITALIIMYYPLSISAQTITWQNTVGGTNDDKLWRAGPTLDGGTFCVGFLNQALVAIKLKMLSVQDLWILGNEIRCFRKYGLAKYYWRK